MDLGLGPAVCFIYSHGSPIFISLIPAQSVAMLPGQQDSKHLATKSHFLQKQNVLRPHVPQSHASAFAGEEAGISPGTPCIQVSLNFDDSNFRS